MGFVELFAELRQHVSDLKRCWQIACRVKRGLLDTSQPGAFYMDQAYFQGAVEILMHLEEVDFGRLYGGQIALQDLDKVHFLLRKEVVRLPLFLNSAEKLQRYLVHCRELMRENMIETAPDKLCKRVFVKAGLQFFKKEERRALKMSSVGGSALSGSVANKTFSPAQTEDEGEPGPDNAADDWEQGGTEVLPRRRNLARLAELALPKSQKAPVEDAAVPALSRSVDLDRLSELARPKVVDEYQVCQTVQKLSPASEAERERALRELAKPKVRPEAPPPAEIVTPARPVDRERLAALAAPRRPSEERTLSKEQPQKRRRRRSKLRLLALLQSRNDSSESAENCEDLPEPPEAPEEEDEDGPEDELLEGPKDEQPCSDGVETAGDLQQAPCSSSADAVAEESCALEAFAEAAPVDVTEPGHRDASKRRPRRRAPSVKAPASKPLPVRQALPIKTVMLGLAVG